MKKKITSGEPNIQPKYNAGCSDNTLPGQHWMLNTNFLSSTKPRIHTQNLARVQRFSGNLVPRFPMNLLSFKKLCGVILGGFINVFSLWYFERYVHDFYFLKLNCKVFYLMCSFLFISTDILKGSWLIFSFIILLCVVFCVHIIVSLLWYFDLDFQSLFWKSATLNNKISTVVPSGLNNRDLPAPQVLPAGAGCQNV